MLSTDNHEENTNASQCQLDAYKKELQCLNTEIYNLGRQKRRIEGNMPTGLE